METTNKINEEKNKKVWEVPELLMMDTKNTEVGSMSLGLEGLPTFRSTHVYGT